MDVLVDLYLCAHLEKLRCRPMSPCILVDVVLKSDLLLFPHSLHAAIMLGACMRAAAKWLMT